MKKVLGKTLDDLIKATAFHREWSPEQLPGYKPDTMFGGYCESDEMFRERIKRELGRTQ